MDITSQLQKSIKTPKNYNYAIKENHVNNYMRRGLTLWMSFLAIHSRRWS